MIKHDLFPTLIGEFKYSDHMSFKETFFKNFHMHSNEQGQSNELTGHTDIHQDPELNPFYVWAGQCAKEYLNELKVDMTKHQLYLVKSWMMITRTWHVPLHAHADAHLSFSYYVNIPEDIKADRICFLSHRQNELYWNVFNQTSTEWNKYNATNWSFDPTEGTMFMFPSKQHHFTQSPDDLNPGNHSDWRSTEKRSVDSHSLDTIRDKRICLAGDMILTYKNLEAKSYGLMPISNWIGFD